MATFPVTVPDALVSELQAIAQAAGFANPKAMNIAYWRAEIRAWRGNNAVVGLREAAEAQADADTAAIA